MIKANIQLDAKGLACPMPIVKTKKSMNDLRRRSGIRSSSN